MVKLFAAGTRKSFVESVCRGSTLVAAACEVGASTGSATRWWRQSGGMPTAGPKRGGIVDVAPQRVVGEPRQLGIADRMVIEVGLAEGWSLARIGAHLSRDKSVICREIARNKSPDGRYYAWLAHTLAHQRRRRPKTFKLAHNPVLCGQIESWMDDGWSPRLIALMLVREHPQDQNWWVSHETIYQALYVQTRGHLRADLHQQLSLRRKQRRPRGLPRPSSSPFKEAFKISERPAEVADRAVPGHWEGDLIVGPNGSAIGTLVERTSRFTILLHLPGRHDADTVAKAMIAQMGDLPQHLRRSITWDRGTELARYADIQTALDLQLFFCDPHSPWQRGSNENTNGLLRQYFPKGTDLSVHDAEHLDAVAAELNGRPRQTLGFITPAEAMQRLLSDPEKPVVATTA